VFENRVLRRKGGKSGMLEKIAEFYWSHQIEDKIAGQVARTGEMRNT
jgi:hypothetical protein